MPTETTLGIQTRYDAIDLGLTDTYHRAFLSNIRSDKVDEGSIGVYAETTVLETKPSKSKDDRGIIYVETRGFNQDGDQVMILRRRILQPRRPA